MKKIAICALEPLRDTDIYNAFFKFYIPENIEFGNAKEAHDGIIEKCNYCSNHVFQSYKLQNDYYWFCSSCHTKLRPFGFLRCEFGGSCYFLISPSFDEKSEYELLSAPLHTDGSFYTEESNSVESYAERYNSLERFIIQQLRYESAICPGALARCKNYRDQIISAWKDSQ